MTPASTPRWDDVRGAWLVAGLGSLALLALALRCLDFARVFLEDGTVELYLADSAYHARRAFYTFVQFPKVLLYDTHMAHPGGAWVPMPPLYDWSLGGLARLFGSSEQHFLRVAAWASPLLAAITVVPVFFAGRSLGGSRLGLGAAAIFAVLPAHARSSALGDADHHAAVALLGALLFAQSLVLLRREDEAGVGASLGLGATLAALGLTWSGSLLYLLAAELCLVVSAVYAGRRDVLSALAFASLAAAAILSGWLLVAGANSGTFAATNLSWAHPAFLALAALGGGGLAITADVWRKLAAPSRVASLGGGLALAAAMAVWIDPGESLAGAFDFFAKRDSWGARNIEQSGLFAPVSTAQGSAAIGYRNFGLFVYLLPLGLLAIAERLRHASLRSAALCAIGWYLILGVLTLLQIRFKSEFAAVFSVGAALLLGGLGTGVARWVPRVPRELVAVLTGFLLLLPALRATYGAGLAAIPGLREATHADGLARRMSGRRTLATFARMVREATPETSGYLDPAQTPEYGVLTKPSHGHAMLQLARRPTPAGNFGPYLDAPKFEQALAFYSARGERQAVEIAQALGARYVTTFARRRAGADLFANRLHYQDGAGRVGSPRAEHFRLVIEGPRGGRPLRSSFSPHPVRVGAIPYKLFEVVEGAVLEVRGEPGQAVEAMLEVETPLGRVFPYRAKAVTDAQGLAQLRVPYATDTALPTRPLGPYRVEIGEEVHLLTVTDADVTSGALIGVESDGS